MVCKTLLTLMAVTMGAAPNDVAKGNTEFAADLYDRLKKEKGNLFFSPLSISTALAMTCSGARGGTADEMAKVMHFGVPLEGLAPSFKALEAQLEKNCGEGNRLAMANGLCLTGGDVSAEFKELLIKYYGAEIFGGDLAKINAWVKGKTEGKIEEILKRLSPNTVCVLLNAVYFKGIWAKQFEKKNTRDLDFTLADGRKIKTPMMSLKSEFRLLRKQGYAALEMPYKDDKLAMVIVLPDEHDGLTELEKSLNAEKLIGLNEQLQKLGRQEVRVSLPRFTIKSPLMDLRDHLKALGMNLAFDMSKADFSGMGWPKGSLCISQVKHKAFVEVNEEGTEAAAATAVEMHTKSIRRSLTFVATRPFLFMIRDKQSGTILFMGRLMDPSES